MSNSASKSSGMCVPCSVRATRDKGRGVFAAADIQAGSPIWRHISGQYEVLDEASLTARLAGGTQEDAVYLLTHIVSMDEFPGFMVNYLDEGALINHGESPNVTRKKLTASKMGKATTSVENVAQALLDTHFDLVASRDIAAGEELLMDYSIEPDDPPWYEQACRRYGVDWDWL